MYFIYFTLFVLMVFVPIIISVVMGDPVLDPREIIEVVLMLLLGSAGFSIYLWQEKRFKLNFRKRVLVQRESHRIFKDLSEAYSYIGEVNRTLEIMKGVALRIPENISKRGRIAYAPFFEALALIGKSGKIAIQFINTANRQIMGEVKTDRRMSTEAGLNNGALIEKPENFFETDEFFIAKSPQPIEGIIAVIYIRRQLSTHRIDDPELMKALSSQALQFFLLNGKKVLG